jgi:hypothetical protein
VPAGVRPGEERRHAGAEESWWFDFCQADGSLGGYVRLAYRPGDRTAWYWAAIVGVGRPLVALRAHDVRIPATGTEIRADGVWACLTCETPLEHWSVGLESFGASMDDPLEAWGAERGDILPFGLDLEWEAQAPAVPASGHGAAAGYGQWCEVHGEVLLGDDRLPVDGRGDRRHRWGPGAARPPGWWVAADGRWAEGEVGGEEPPAGGGGAPGPPPRPPRPPRLETVWDAAGLPVSAVLTAGGQDTALTVGAVSPVAVPGLAVVHALCEAAPPAGPAWGWAGWATPR